MEATSVKGDLATLTHSSTAFKVLGAIGFSHLLNDMIQSLIPAIYPLLKDSLSLNFTQIGLITLTFQVTASLLQPMVGLYTDHHPQPYSLSIGIGCTLIGLLILSFAPSYGILLIAAAMVGTGSSVFHPESSRVARMASGGRYGLAQSIFQVGGSFYSYTPRAAQHCVVLIRCAPRHGCAMESWRLVQAPAVTGQAAEEVSNI
jgi:FSR family fosmidomycin resistance protein-like MFS transporter